ncbi:asparagine synthase-related protein [Aegicerativicinus sediminis]|uniref:asparagine synthase-related protein n=1 Tax=Aegicerativicinus sediminis TaxID=2893202 RepID=UPI001E59A7F2|nr:asparagine synthase-related protein [Aegicerativicinus sediminis]
MITLKTPIIPTETTIAKVEGNHDLDLEAICLFIAFGFFFDTDTYWKDEKVLSPGSIHTLNKINHIVSSEKWFNWHYSPRELKFNEALEEFTELFERIVWEQTENKRVILPISGGLDSRTLAVALRNHPNVASYSYEFQNGYPETKIARQIAKACQFPFTSLTVPKGYLWNCIEELAEINQCYSEFTHPRQMAFINEFKGMGNLFSLGHMGDLMFDSFGFQQLSVDKEVEVLTKLLLKKGGAELASSLWKIWGLKGDFKDYYSTRIKSLLEEIDIKETNPKIRAFKTHYYVSRWSSNNLSVFKSIHPVSLPYFDDNMCEFICTVPEKYLANRQLQIAYIKQIAPDLAKITWQGQKPFNLNSYHLNKSPFNLPYRASNKIKRILKESIGKPYVSRNWELQFLGKENDTHLRKWLFESNLKGLVPIKLIEQFYTNFKQKETLVYSHPVSMLLTLALFQQKINY